MTAAEKKMAADFAEFKAFKAMQEASASKPAAAKASKPAPVVETTPSMIRWHGDVAGSAPGKNFTATLKSGATPTYCRLTLAQATEILKAQYESGVFYASRA